MDPSVLLSSIINNANDLVGIFFVLLSCKNLTIYIILPYNEATFSSLKRYYIKRDHNEEGELISLAYYL